MSRVLRVVGSGLADEAIAPLAVATRLDTLEELLGFGFAQAPPWQLRDVVVQDEFTHDVVVECATAFLVFDTT